MTEADFQSAVIELAQLCGWRVAHFRAAMTKDGRWRTPVAGDGKGFPDLVLVRDRVLFVELKSESGRVTSEQRAWIDALVGAGAGAEIWRPADWDHIEWTLKRRRSSMPAPVTA